MPLSLPSFSLCSFLQCTTIIMAPSSQHHHCVTTITPPPSWPFPRATTVIPLAIIAAPPLRNYCHNPLIW
ncbi:hypothetical protein GYH30_009501 [Glycine max]|nr:hypothetical protein GYH30_009501 [Glycine max]